MVEPAAGLQQIHSHSTRDITLRGAFSWNWLNDGAISGEAQIEDDVFNLLG
jgi:hypothetical protein